MCVVRNFRDGNSDNFKELNYKLHRKVQETKKSKENKNVLQVTIDCGSINQRYDIRYSGCMTHLGCRFSFLNLQLS